MKMLLRFLLIVSLLTSKTVLAQDLTSIYHVDTVTAFSQLGPIYEVVAYDGSIWKRKGGTVSVGTPGYGGVLLEGDSSGHYERIFSGSLDVHWFGARGDSSTDDRIAFQRCIDYAEVSSHKRIHLRSGKYILSATLSGVYRTLLTIPSGVTMGGEPGTMIIAKPNTFTLNNTTYNRLVINKGSVNKINSDQNITLENILFDCNGHNQITNTLNGVFFERVTNPIFRNITIRNATGTGAEAANGLIETCAISTRLCYNVLFNNCKVENPSTFAISSTGFADTRCTDVKYVNCISDGARAMGFTTYFSANVSYRDCYAWNVGTNSFNEEHGHDVDYFHCVAGIQTASQISSGEVAYGAPFPIGQNRTSVSTTFKSFSSGFYLLNNSGGTNIRLTNCIARNFTDGTGNSTHAGLAMRGIKKSTVSAVSSTTLTIADSLFTRAYVGRKVLAAANSTIRQIVQYISPTQVVLNNTISVSTGTGMILYGPDVKIENCDFAQNDYPIFFDDDSGNRAYASRTVRINNTKVSPNTANKSWRYIGPTGPNERWVVGSGVPVDGVVAALEGSGTNIPSIPASGTIVFNDFPFDVMVYVTGGTGVSIGVLGNTPNNNTPYGSLTSPFRIPAGGRIRVNYSAVFTSWDWLPVD
ncbi:glycosyl hydrolase family 28-related protein [Larkinella rosea]|uniref:Rhamnogalacturonase A/B/Epimerase-like pectate lyase domain-containing protein n=1 Tax=Larkinella rosea TaxID=2025312 RepID=A0A3P1BIF2_9BACT|nr:glycosyl hydrolase family 28-related protein [Larkinella rosea]RRB00666.1 hypothetical protein EHT25_20945 [Larkinella rosea]